MASPDAKPSPDEGGEAQEKPVTVSLERVLDLLQHGVITEQHGLLGWGSNHTFLVSVTDESLEMLAVYKPKPGERPLWDFPEGTLCHREMAAYLVSEGLGWGLVPPTVLREGPRGVGSLQFFVHHDPAVNYFSLREQSDARVVFRLMQFAAFDVVVNNADRKGGHFLLAPDGHLWGIDHGLTFNLANKLRTVLWDFAGRPVPDSMLADLRKLEAQLEPGAGLRCALEEMLAPQEVEMTLVRVRRLLKRGRFPQPGPGPNYPWPPV